MIKKSLLIFLCLAVAVLLIPHTQTNPIVHIFIQLPLLIATGIIAAYGLSINKEYAITLLIISLVMFIYWMLPRNIDAALTSPTIDSIKFITLPFLLGAPLTLSWPYLHPILKGILKANTISMLAVLAFLYTHAPTRICNSYLLSDQYDLGISFLALASILTILWSWPPLFGSSPQTIKHDRKRKPTCPSKRLS